MPVKKSANPTDAPKVPAVTVCIVAYQSGHYLQDCLDALATQTFTDFEAVVIDNDSVDGSIEALRLPDARFRVELMRANLGFAAGNNVSARASKSEWFATLNPDTQAKPEWLGALMAATKRWPKAASFGSTQVDLRYPLRLDGIGDCWHVAGVAWRARWGKPVSRVAPEGEIFGPCAAAALYRRDVFMELDGFYEPFFCYCEDVDIAYRLQLAGWQAVQVPDAVVLHAGSAITGRYSGFTLFHGHRNRVWTWVKNTPEPWIWTQLPLHLAYDAFMAFSVWRDGGSWKAVMRAYIAAVKGLKPILADRRKLMAERKASLPELARVMAWNPLAPLVRDIVKMDPPPSK